MRCCSQQQGLLGLLLLLIVPCLLAVSCQASEAASSTQHASTTQPTQTRYVVSFHNGHRQQLQQQLQEHGYRVLSEGPDFFTVTHPTASLEEAGSSAAAATNHRHHGRQLIEAAEAAHRQHTARLSGMPGVHSSEQDVRRHLHLRPSLVQHGSPSHRTLAAAAASDSAGALSKLLGHWHMGQRPQSRGFDQWGADVVDAVCAARDVQPTPDVPGSEVIPWGVKEVGAWNSELQKLPPKGRSIVCIIDSGLWGGHPEYSASSVPGRQDSPHNTFTGCQDRGNCPYEFNNDQVGHGTHVAGTISAPANGIGVVGVMSQGAEVLVVRVWNNNGDVSQGQGPYATDLVLAYSHCLDHLKAEQAKEAGSSSGKRVSMVINMSFGSAGPLTVERIWIERAAQRGDILFVGSAGNNGSWLDVGKRTAGPASLSGSQPVGQYLSYPASYRLNEMLSVANARCDGSIEFTSQKNKQVSIAAPGMAILSSVPREHGIVRGHISTTVQVKAAGKQRGAGFLANGFLEPRPIQGSALKSTQSLPLVSCSLRDDQQQRLRLFGKNKQDAAVTPGGTSSPGSSSSAVGSKTCAGAQGALCFMELPGKAHLSEEACAAMAKCVRSGGAGLVAWQHLKPQDADAFYSIPATQLDCGPTCKCWADLKASLGCADMDSCSSKAPPAILIAPQHAAALAAAGAGKGDAVKAAVASYEYNYKYFDGTSMAAPHVTGAAALLWRQFPHCTAADIANALKMSAQRLPGQQEVPDYASGYGMLKVDRAHEWMQQNNACARKS